MRDYLNTNAPTHFLFPIDGECVNERDGVAIENGVAFTATVASAPGCKVTIGGVAATELNGVYVATVKAKGYRTEIEAKNLTDGTSATVSVFMIPNSIGKYRISSDDNILFLADITYNKDKYTSIFDNPYLAVYKKAHDLYGAKVHLNIFYAFDREAASRFTEPREDFDLSMMTDKFKDEWRANADWLKLSFHAKAEYPSKPYKFATGEQITEDFLAVKREILRFAGEETFSGDATTVHWGETSVDALRAMRKLGHTRLAGYFQLTSKGVPSVSYHTTKELVEHVYNRDFWVDTEEDVIFSRIDRVTNTGTLERSLEVLQDAMNDPHRGGFVEFMIHEQYFYPDYRGYLADFEARVLEPAKLLAENGYTAAFLKEMN